MCKYKTIPVMVDADQFLCELGKEPTFIPNGVYEKEWKTDTSETPIMKQWGVDGMFGFIKVNDGDWVVKQPDSKYYEVYSDGRFHKKFEKSIWQQ